mmetsp:Transcript_26879/g.41147  ORF Transcript_26879/g.41147 Transcript_26879/m.41147 type:complete len:234 (-) Transcript_26879:873-1574(-)
MMGRSIISNNSSSVQNHSYGQVLNGDVVHDLIISALHKCRINGNEGLQSLTGHTSCHGDSMLFCDTDIEGTLGEASSENIHSCSTGHSGCDSNYRAIFCGSINKSVGEDGSERGGTGRLLLLYSGSDVEFSNSVHLITGRFGRGVSLSLISLNVKQDGFCAVTITKLLQYRDHVSQIMSVDGSNIVKSKLLKKGSSTDNSTSILIKTLIYILDILGKETVETLGETTEILEWF